MTSPKPPDSLHIAQIQRIVGKHRNNRLMPLSGVIHTLKSAAADTGERLESRDYARIREQLKRELGLEIGEVLELARRWPT